MNFLALAQKLVEKGGIAGSGPTSVVSQSGELKRAVNWINEAWLNIQESRADWSWMRASVSFSTIAQQATYTPAQCGISDLASWLLNSKINTFRTYVTSVGIESEIFLSYLPYDTWRDTYQYGAMRTSYSRPTIITVTPDMSLGLGLAPNSTDYTIVGDYFTTPTTLVANTDVPGLPDRFHMLIVYQAMMYYAEYEKDDNLYARAQKNYNDMLRRMNNAQLPEMTMGGALA